jgi:hypothetical protein
LVFVSKQILICDDTINVCHLVNSSSGAILKLTFNHEGSTAGLVLNNDTRAIFIKQSWKTLEENERYGDYKFIKRKVLFLCLKLYYSGKPMELIREIDTVLEKSWNNYIYELPEIFGHDVPQEDPNIDEKLVIRGKHITDFLTVLREELFSMYQGFLEKEPTDYIGQFTTIDDALAYVRNYPEIQKIDREINEYGSSNKELTSNFREKISKSVSLVEGYKVPKEEEGTNIKMMILLKLFWHDCQAFIPRVDFPFNYLMESIFASFFTKSILCHEESLDALTVLKRKIPIKLWVNPTKNAPQRGYEKEVYYLAHIEEYVRKVEVYMKKSLYDPLVELTKPFIPVEKKLRRKIKI